MLKAFFADVQKRWSNLQDHIIGYVVWTSDRCWCFSPWLHERPVRYEARRKRIPDVSWKSPKLAHLSIVFQGRRTPPAKFKTMMYNRIDVPSDFRYREDGLCSTRYAFRRGHLPSVKYLRLMFHGRKHFAMGNLNSLEVAIHPHDSDAFSMVW